MNAPSNALDRLVGPNAQVLAGSQATAIEQSRAVAEVQAMVVVAQQRPRNIEVAKAEMRRSCDMPEMAKRAFYRYSRSGSNVTGPTVHLMRELARCFGNITYGIAELSRNDEAGISEMQAFAWDLQTNTRSAQIFMVPHKRDKKGGAVRLDDLRDIYEQTTNQGARRVREAIRAVLPPWYVEEAIDLCNATLERGDGKPLADRIAEAVNGFARGGVTVAQLEAKLGRPRARWDERDVATLGVIYKSIDRRETTAAEEFPPAPVTVDEVRARTQRASSEEPAPFEDSYDGSYDGPSEPPVDESLAGVWPDPKLSESAQ